MCFNAIVCCRWTPNSFKSFFDYTTRKNILTSSRNTFAEKQLQISYVRFLWAVKMHNNVAQSFKRVFLKRYNFFKVFLRFGLLVCSCAWMCVQEIDRGNEIVQKRVSARDRVRESESVCVRERERESVSSQNWLFCRYSLSGCQHWNPTFGFSSDLKVAPFFSFLLKASFREKESFLKISFFLCTF